MSGQHAGSERVEITKITLAVAQADELATNKMKYQAIKHNKTGSRGLGMFATLAEAVEVIRSKGASFHGISYFGGFPTWKGEDGKVYSVQGYAEQWGIVCSLPKDEVETFAF